MAKQRDYQRSKVYSWEATYLTPSYGKTLVSVEHAQPLVDHVWHTLGLSYPPKVEPISAQTRRWAGTASRTCIRLQPVVSTRVVLHEIAHALMQNFNDDCDGHGPQFIGMYYKLLEQFLKVPGPMMLFTLQKAGVYIDLSVSPYYQKRVA